jgi:hypothetical protein
MKHGLKISAVLMMVVCIKLGFQSAQAAIVTDNFTGYSESLFGESGGSSSGGMTWTSGWGDQGFASSPTVINSALGSVNGFGSSSPYVQYQLNTTANSPLNVSEATRSFTSQANVSSLYVYFLVARGGANNNNSYGGVGLYSGTTEQFLIGERFGSGNWGATAAGNLGGAGNDSGVAIGSFSTTLLLAKINQQANTLSLYVNPNFSLTEAQNTAAFTVTYGTGNDAIDTVRLRGGNQNNQNTWQWDNLNISTDSPFTPVPEPVNVALVVFGSLIGITVGVRKLRLMRLQRNK